MKEIHFRCHSAISVVSPFQSKTCSFKNIKVWRSPLRNKCSVSDCIVHFYALFNFLFSQNDIWYLYYNPGDYKSSSIADNSIADSFQFCFLASPFQPGFIYANDSHPLSLRAAYIPPFASIPHFHFTKNPFWTNLACLYSDLKAHKIQIIISGSTFAETLGRRETFSDVCLHLITHVKATQLKLC